MKTLNFILVSSLMLLFSLSCSDPSSPSSIAKAYTKAVMNCDFEDAAIYVANDVRSTYKDMDLVMDESMKKLFRAVLEDVKFEVVEEEIGDSSAEIIISIKKRGSNFSDRRVTLIKEEGVWKVNQKAAIK